MFPCVSDERRRDREGHAAQITLVWFLSRVSPFVVGQGAGLSEGLTADVAHVRLFATVKSDVYFVVGRGSELETAAVTRVGLLFAVVHPAMSDELTLLSETLLTVGATERLLSCVNAQVTLQGLQVAEACPAGVAGVRLLPGVDQNVCPQMGNLHKPSSTGVTAIRFLSRVNARVSLQIGRAVKLGATHVTAIGFIT